MKNEAKSLVFLFIPAERTELSVYSPAYHIKLIITHNQAFTYLLI